MTATYRIADGSTLVVQTGDAPWQSVTFHDADFADPQAATAAELAAKLSTLDGIEAADEAGTLVLTSAETGEYAAVTVDVVASTAAAALGITGQPVARGSGPGAARLVGTGTEPFQLPEHAVLHVAVDGGKPRKVVLDLDGPVDAETVAKAINSKLRRTLASRTAAGAVRLTSPTSGVGSALAVTPPEDDAPDAAALLGFTGSRAATDPYPAAPARLRCPRYAGTAQLISLTAVAVELQLATGRLVLPARGTL
ncbi:MAG: hypothetical protein J2P15_19620, partial [Micromonosporaceae bacterium]|nr:hypothetical protein [Micromonosporaceae bacterium]